MPHPLILLLASLFLGGASAKTSPSKTSKSGLEMVHVEGGTFVMGGKDDVDDGGPQGGANADECPHEVTVSSFLIGKFEVTQADWVSVMEENPSAFRENLECPVEQVSWEEVQEFISRLNAKHSRLYRLPTEEEWEYAARGGMKTKGYRYSVSNNASEVAWYKANSCGTTHPVGMLGPNELGIHDMSGNIWEWCQNSKTPYPCDSTGKEFESKVLRGGTWSHGLDSVRVRDRNARDSKMRLPTLGFRLALDGSKNADE